MGLTCVAVEAAVLPFFVQFDVVVQSASDATRVSAFSEAFTEAGIGGEVTQVAARRLPM